MDLTGPADVNLPLEGFPQNLWEQVSLARHRLLMLDHDGTLVAFETLRNRAIPPRRLRELLVQVAETSQTTVVMVSGRPVRELADLLERPPVTLVGEHGWEWCDPGERVVRHPLPRGAATRLDRAERLARDAGLASRLERKRASVAVHTRGLDAAAARDVTTTAARAWTSVLEGAPLRLAPFDGGLELRVRGRSKATAVRDLLTREPADTLAVHVGDDDTDEDAFEALAGIGFGVRVGEPGPPTKASAWLRDPGEVAVFLERWLEVTTAETHRRG